MLGDGLKVSVAPYWGGSAENGRRDAESRPDRGIPAGIESKAYLFLAAGAVKVNGARVAAVMARQPCATKKRFASSRCRMPRSSW
jgi:hypothetical protein